MPAKGSAEWRGDVPTGNGDVHGRRHDQRGVYVQVPI